MSKQKKHSNQLGEVQIAAGSGKRGRTLVFRFAPL